MKLMECYRYGEPQWVVHRDDRTITGASAMQTNLVPTDETKISSGASAKPQSVPDQNRQKIEARVGIGAALVFGGLCAAFGLIAVGVVSTLFAADLLPQAKKP